MSRISTFLVINTLISDRLSVALFKEKKLISKKELKVGWQQAEKLLKLINQLLINTKVKLEDLSGIIGVRGPGSFTAVRIGCLVVNTLSYSLKIPAVGLKLNEFKDYSELIDKGREKIKKKKSFSLVQPFYGRSPNITKPRKK